MVTGHDAAAVRDALAGRAVRFAHASDFADGLSASLRAGLDALSPDVDGALVCLGDMPLVPSATLDRLIEAFDPEEGRAIAVPTAAGCAGNPVLWAAEFFSEMRGLTGDAGARRLLDRHADRIVEVATEGDAVLRDFDTPDALAASEYA